MMTVLKEKLLIFAGTMANSCPGLSNVILLFICGMIALIYGSFASRARFLYIVPIVIASAIAVLLDVDFSKPFVTWISEIAICITVTLFSVSFYIKNAKKKEVDEELKDEAIKSKEPIMVGYETIIERTRRRINAVASRFYIERYEVLFLGIVSIISSYLLISITSVRINLLRIYVLIEIINLCAYGILLSRKDREDSMESVLQYVIYNVIFSAIFLLGMFLIYYCLGTLELPISLSDSQKYALIERDSMTINAGISLILIFMMFKIGAAPFHLWMPWLYRQAPTYALQVIAVMPKIALLYVLWKMSGVFFISYRDICITCINIIKYCGYLSAIWGAIAIMRQKMMNRLLAYSSIFNIGILLIYICLYYGDKREVASSFFDASNLYSMVFNIYLFAYGIFGIGQIFFLFSYFDDPNKSISLSDMYGLGQKYPFFGLNIAILMLVLSGIPPFLFFHGKLLTIGIIMQKNLYLGVSLFILSLIVCYKYISILVIMFFCDAKKNIEDLHAKNDTERENIDGKKDCEKNDNCEDYYDYNRFDIAKENRLLYKISNSGILFINVCFFLLICNLLAGIYFSTLE